MVPYPRVRHLLVFVLLSALPIPLARSATLEVTVVDASDRAPIEGAFVMVGEGRGLPFPGNTATTPASGTVVFQHPDLVGPQTVTAGADSFAYSAVIKVAENTVTLPLYRSVADTMLYGPAARITGRVNGIEIVNNDGFIDAGIIFPTTTIDAVLGAGQPGFYVPPDVADLPFIGEVPIPGNIVLPNQTEFLVYNFSKEIYMIDVPAQTTQTMFSVAARVPVEVILDPPDEFDIVNFAEVREIGVERDVPVGDGLELNIDSDIDLSRELTIRIEGAPDGSQVTAMSLGSLTNLQGEERFLGYDAKYELADDHDGLLLASVVPQGDLSDVQNLVAGTYSDSSAYIEWATGRIDRTPFTLPAERVLTDFYDPPTVTQQGARFTWDDVADPGTEPDPTWTTSTIRRVPIDPADTTVVQMLLWNIVIPADAHEFALPALPIDAPGPPAGLIDVATTPDEDRLVLDVTLSNAAGTLDDILVSPSRDATHFSRRTVELEIPPAGVIGVWPAASIGLAIHPNPSAGEVRIRRTGPPEIGIGLEILNLEGRRIRTLTLGSGEHEVVWNGRDGAGRSVSAGVYFVRPIDRREKPTRKIHLVR